MIVRLQSVYFNRLLKNISCTIYICIWKFTNGGILRCIFFWSLKCTAFWDVSLHSVHSEVLPSLLLIECSCEALIATTECPRWTLLHWPSHWVLYSFKCPWWGGWCIHSIALSGHSGGKCCQCLINIWEATQAIKFKRISSSNIHIVREINSKRFMMPFQKAICTKYSINMLICGMLGLKANIGHNQKASESLYHLFTIYN